MIYLPLELDISFMHIHITKLNKIGLPFLKQFFSTLILKTFQNLIFEKSD